MKTRIPVLSDQKQIIDKLSSSMTKASKDMLCFYSSTINSIITDPLFMSVSLEDKLIHRAYSVFDTTKIFNNKINSLDQHVDRLFESINYISLTPKYSKEEIKDILTQMALKARELEPTSDIDLRYFYSAGLGNFLTQEFPDQHTFYVLAIRANNSVRPVNGTADVLINKQQIMRDTSRAKTTNYMHNCIITKKSKEKNGYLGIITDDEGNLLESPISNIAFVNTDNEFVVPSFDKCLKGTTVTKCFKYIDEVLIKEGLIKSVSRVDTNIKDIKEGKIKEAMFLGGDFLIPLLKIDDCVISSEVGVISNRLKEFLEKQKKVIADDLPVNYFI